MGNKDDSFYIEKSLDEIEAIDATMFRLIQLVEHIKNLSSDFKSRHPEIPWGSIIGFRNGIVHEYGRTDYTTVYEIVSKDVFQLKSLFERAVRENSSK